MLQLGVDVSTPLSGASPLDSVDFGLSEHCGLPRLHRRSEAVAQPRSFQPGSSPGLGNVARCGHNGRIESRQGSSVRGHAGFREIGLSRWT